MRPIRDIKECITDTRMPTQYGQEATKRPSPVQESMDMLFANIENLSKTIEVLRIKLDSVMPPKQECLNAVKERVRSGNESSLVTSINDCSDNLSDLKSKLEDMIESVEL